MARASGTKQDTTNARRLKAPAATGQPAPKQGGTLSTNKTMMKNQLQKASDHRREANRLYEKSDRLKPLTIIIIGLALVAGITAKFTLAVVTGLLGLVLLGFACRLNRSAEAHWKRSHVLVRASRAFTFSEMQRAARRRLEAGESSARGRGHRPIVEHAVRAAR